MEENFNVIAQSRANYYVPKSPAQLVRIEVLRGDVSGENVVCLTFKNISPTVFTSFDVLFTCKGTNGEKLCEKQFSYQDLQVKTGEMFGMDDAIFETKSAIGSAEVSILKVFSGKRAMDLSELKRQSLQPLVRLEPEVEAALTQRMACSDLKYAPKRYENGWHCACGAFHPKEENTAYCSECGSDLILVESSLKAIMETDNSAENAVQTNESAPPRKDVTVIMPDSSASNAQKTVFVAPPKEVEEDVTRTVIAGKAGIPESAQIKTYAREYKNEKYSKIYDKDDDDDEYETIDPRDEVAENIIRWVPVITALLCATIAIGGFLYVAVFA